MGLQTIFNIIILLVFFGNITKNFKKTRQLKKYMLIYFTVTDYFLIIA